MSAASAFRSIEPEEKLLPRDARGISCSSCLSRGDLLTKSSVRTYLLSVADMKPPDVARILKEHGIQPSAQRVAVAEYVLHTTEHPSADKVWAGVQKHFPM